MEAMSVTEVVIVRATITEVIILETTETEITIMTGETGMRTLF
jgi:hypothetical protein